ncbi:hypothetical protein F1728_16145 [Gimesia benthica]|uniref:HEAT repeat domain-containing protein n=1 Tax=Gimesia benthica TaxID=2608982 RepID=A0A6I6ACU1_9PLAN|nr:hypothetical protein [Gimesia benthica]QGQ24127.1 hypothetical protein F1728_16145 [Gimesia benthica]
MDALTLMRIHRSSFDNSELVKVSIEQASESENILVREQALSLLKSLNREKLIPREAILTLIDSRFEESQSVGLQLLAKVDPSLTIEMANKYLKNSKPELQAVALNFLGELDPQQAREVARRKLNSAYTQVRVQGFLTLQKLKEPVDENLRSQIVEALIEEIQSTRFVGHERMSRLWLLHEVDAGRAIAVAESMMAAKQLGTLPENFLRTVQTGQSEK